MKTNYNFREKALSMFVTCSLGLLMFLSSCDDEAKPDEPPQNATALTATVDETSVILNWTAPTDADLSGYTVTYTPGNVTSNFGLVTTATITNLPKGQEYTFTLISIDAAGNTSPGITATATIIGGNTLPFSENFETSCPTGLPVGWIKYSTASNIDWACVSVSTITGAGNFAVQGNSFGGDAPAKDWLITPDLALQVGNNSFLSFDYSREFSDVAGFGLEARISTNYIGSGDPAAATWTKLEAGIDNTRSNNTLVKGLASLSAFSGKAYIAFYYTSSGTAGGAGARIRVDNVAVSK